MNRGLVVAGLIVGMLVLAQVAFAQAPPVYYGHLPTSFYSIYQGPYVVYYTAGIYHIEPFFPPGMILSQPYLRLPIAPPPPLYNYGGPPPIYQFVIPQPYVYGP